MKIYVLILSLFFGMQLYAQHTPYLTYSAQISSLDSMGIVTASAVAVDQLGNSIIAVQSNRSMLFQPFNGEPVTFSTQTLSNNIVVYKLNSSNELLWSFTLVTSFLCDYLNLKLDEKGDIYLSSALSLKTGDSTDLDPDPLREAWCTNPKKSICFLAKYSSSGNYLWHNSFDSEVSHVLWNIEVKKDRLYVGGEKTLLSSAYLRDTTLTFNYPGHTGILYALDTTGNYRWHYHLQASNSSVQQVRITDSGNLIVAGEFSKSFIYSINGSIDTLITDKDIDIFLTRLDDFGEMKWMRQIGGKGKQFVKDLDISDLNVYISGTFTDEIFYDQKNNLKYPNTGFSFLFSYNSSTGSFKDYIAIKTSVYGLRIDDFALDELNNLYLVGEYFDTLFYTINDSEYVLTNNNPTGTPSFFLKMDSTGRYYYVYRIDKEKIIHNPIITVTPSYEILMLGQFDAQLNVDLQPTTSRILTAKKYAYYDVFFAKYQESSVGLEENENHSNTRIYPNPSNGTSLLRLESKAAQNAVVDVYDMNGRKIETLFEGTLKVGISELTLDAQHLQSGVYMVNVQLGEKRETLRWIKY